MAAIVALLAVLAVTPAAALAQPPAPAAGARLQLDSLDRLAGLADETVNISIDPAMLKIASAFMQGQGDEAQLKALLSDMQGIYVRVFEFDRDVPFAAELDAVRKQLTTGAWSRLITVDSKRDGETVEIYSWREGNASGGLAVLVAEPRELVVVNIVGPIDLEKLGALQGRFGIPRLPTPIGPAR